MQETQDTWVQFLGQEDPLEEGMGTHSSIHPWRIPWTGEPDGPWSIGSQRVRHDWATDLIWSLMVLMVKNYPCRRHKTWRFDPWVNKIPWRRAWQPIPVSLPGESHGQRSLIGYSPQSHKESDTTEATEQAYRRAVVHKVVQWLCGGNKVRDLRCSFQPHELLVCWIIHSPLVGLSSLICKVSGWNRCLLETDV